MDGKKPTEPQEVADEELGSVIGGLQTHVRNGKHYRYVGTYSKHDRNLSYLCPNCGRPVCYTGWGRFHCNACDEAWFPERNLIPNTESGVWEEMSDEEYKAYQERIDMGL